jgi:hypothetical protein
MRALLLVAWAGSPPSDGFLGKAPDVGAQYRGEAQIPYGVRPK